MSTQPIEKETIGIQTFLQRDLKRLLSVLDQLTPTVDDPIRAKTVIKMVKGIVDQIQAEIEDLEVDDLIKTTIDYIQHKTDDLIAFSANPNYEEDDRLLDIIQGNLYTFEDIIDLVIRELETLPNKEEEQNNENQEETQNSIGDLTPVEDDEDYEEEPNEDYYADD